MIYSVEITNHNNESVLLDLFHPETSGLAIQSIEGLGPAKADIQSSETATIDGGIFNYARQNQRNIVFNLLMLFNPTIETSRLAVYKYFPIKKQIRMVFKTEHRHAEATGYVEAISPNIFSKEETVQISVICPDPNFYELGSSQTLFTGVVPEFEFPFSNESLTEPLLNFGEIQIDTRATLDYVGDSDTGIVINIHALGPAENITIWNNITREKIAIDTAKVYRRTNVRFDLGDDIIISTVKGSKYVQLLHDGVYYNIVSCINKDADWFQLTNGDNIYTFTADSGENYLLVTFNYRNAYGGI